MKQLNLATKYSLSNNIYIYIYIYVIYLFILYPNNSIPFLISSHSLMYLSHEPPEVK